VHLSRALTIALNLTLSNILACAGEHAARFRAMQRRFRKPMPAVQTLDRFGQR
jgi:hypothetical protein